MSEPPENVRDWVHDVLGAADVEFQQMAPASTQMHQVRVGPPERPVSRFVLRRYVDAHRLATDPFYDPENEAQALRLMRESTIPAPSLLAEDLDATRCDVPALLLSWVPGKPAWVPGNLGTYMRTAAQVLAGIHGLLQERPDDLPAYVRYAMDAPMPVVVPGWSRTPAIWERALEIASDRAPSGPVGFIHRDYHAGNALADHDRVVAVVDWPTAAWGPLGIDLGRMRQNLAFDVDPMAAEGFLIAYRDAGGPPDAYHPYWDLVDAVDGLVGASPPHTGDDAAGWERLERWVGRAVAELA